MILSEKQKKVLLVILENGPMSSSAVHEKIAEAGEKISLVTVKRVLSGMALSGLLNVSGSGPSTSYDASALGRLFAPIDAKKYCAVEPDKRYGSNRYNFEILAGIPPEIFDEPELKILNTATAEYEQRTKDLSDVIRKKELERLIIELAWKSSKIEGNTYSLLDTEKLIFRLRKFLSNNINFLLRITRLNRKIEEKTQRSYGVFFGLNIFLFG